MRLSDIMGSMDLASYAEVGLILFLAAFLAIVVWVFLKRNRARFERARHLPLENDDLPRHEGPSEQGEKR